MEKVLLLKPIKETSTDYEALEAHIKEVFKKEIYYPLMAEFNARAPKLKNSKNDLLEAIQSGRIQFNRGVFSGKFDASISKELRKLGAKWDNSAKVYKLLSSDLPMSIRMAVSSSAVHFQSKLEKIDKKLAAILPDEVADKVKAAKFFDSALWKVEKALKKTVPAIVIVPDLNKAQRQKIADDWQNNMKLWIKDFTKKEIGELREKVKATYFAGNRYGSLIKTIEKSYDVSANKAKFLARQETSLLMTTHKEVRYQDSGVVEYKWRSVTGTANHPVRPMHKALNDRSEKGEIFRFDSPPVDDPHGGRHNPGQNYNCRCTAVPVVRFK